MFAPVKEMFSESVERRGGWERENWLLYCHRNRFSARKAEGGRKGEGKAACKVNGGRVADGS